MTKTLPGSVGPAHQPIRRPGLVRIFGEGPGQPFPSGNLGTCRHLPTVAAREGYESGAGVQAWLGRQWDARRVPDR